MRWIDELGQEDFDPHLLLWDMRRQIDVEASPRRRTVVAMRFTDVQPGASQWWLVCREGDLDLCDFDPGFAVAATVTTRLPVMTRIWRGGRSWLHALRAEELRIDGDADAVGRVPVWLGQAGRASVPRPSERELAARREPALAGT